MATTYLQKVPSSVGSTTTATFSFWVKIAGTGTQAIYTVHDGSAQFDIFVRNASGQVDFYGYNGSSFDFRLHTSRLLRDHNAWYHIVCKVDLTNSTQADRAILYINGVRETAFSIETYPSNASATAIFSKNSTTTIGATHTGGSDLDGVLSHFHFCDGYAYDASTFGSTDATTGEWKINTSPNVQYGTNGFFLFKDNASTTDQSGQGNNWSVTAGALVDTKDNPSNNFATSNVLDNGADKAPTFGNGNLTHSVGSSVWRFVASTLGAHKGKFYSEIKIHSVSNNVMLGAGDRFDIDNNDMAYNAYPGGEPLGVGYLASNGNSYLNDSGSSYGNSYTANDIIGVAMDIDNGFVYFSKNGVFQNSGDPTSGASGTGGIAFPSTSSATGIKQFMPGLNNANISVNYGGGHFGVTAISTNSGNGYAGVEGDSKFNYQPPTGYAALSTKGLNYF